MRSLAEVNEDITQALSTNKDWQSVIEPLYEERHKIIKHDRDAYEDENYFVLIDCPIHITHKATLFTQGHRYQGVWECPEDYSDTCPHYDAEIEETEDSQGNKDEQCVCVKCGKVVDD